MAMAIVETRPITGGIDTHLEVHVAAALDANGGVLGVESFPTTPAGYVGLHAGWLRSVRSTALGSKAPAPTAPVWPGTCALRDWR
jgi:hypothetical protein